MRRLLRALLGLTAIIILVPVIGVVVVLIALNSQSGRNFAAAEINHFAGPQMAITGLSGHFPADLKLAHLTVSDAQGPWLTGDQLELRWTPADLLSRSVHVTALTAANISVARAPLPSKPSPSSSFNLPKFRLNLDALTINALHLGAPLAGTPTTLRLTGSTHLQSLTTGAIQLTATPETGPASYQLTAAIDPQTINTTLHISEPPDGLLGHYAGPQVHAPLNIDLTLQGPRNKAALNFTAALGAAQLNGTGTISLDPDAPKSDVVLTIPALAPYGALAGQRIAGSTELHFIASQDSAGTRISLDGDVALNQAPGPLAKLVGPHGNFSTRLSIAGNAVNIQNLAITGAGFSIALNGQASATGVNLNTNIALTGIAGLAPGISGAIAETGTITGAPKNFAVDANLTGNIEDQKIPSGPFAIAIHAKNLPSLPSGTLTGAGALEGSPLKLDAAFTRDAQGAATVTINSANWRSLSAKAHLAFAPGVVLPTGDAQFAIRTLDDFRSLSPVPLSGSIDGLFVHQGGQIFSLTLNAANLLALPSLGAVNGKLTASGPANALNVKLAASIARVLNFPARITTAGVVNLDARSANIANFTAAWRSLNANLLGPAVIASAPGITIRHLALALNGGTITLDGAITPRLNAKLAVQNLPASLAALAAPGIAATGTLSATAALTGSLQNPAGAITLAANAIKLHTGPAAAIPPATLTAKIQSAGRTANLNAALSLGPDANLAANGLVPLTQSGPLSLHLTGTTDLRLLDPILAAAGSTVRGIITPDLTITGTPETPLANGTLALAGGSIQNIGSGLNLTKITANLAATGNLVTLQNLTAAAGHGSITGHGTINLADPNLPLDLAINADNATPVSSDLVTEALDAALTIKGDATGAMALAGRINIRNANINIPKSLPPSVANLPIINRGQPLPPAPPPAPPFTLDLLIRAKNQIFIRGDGLFAELGGKIRITGTAANPDPEGGFSLVRGSYALAGKTLQFTQGLVSFNGDGFMPTLDLEATTTTTSNSTASLIIGGTAAKPTITLSASPPLPSDEVLSQLLFGQATASLSPFQAASLAAALASLSGVGGSAISDPLGGIRNALGLDELSLGGSGSGAPSIQAGRYVAPGVYVGAQQSTTGQGTQATVQINLYKGLKLQTATGSSGSGTGSSSSVGLTYQFNY
jgi:translocation and assembly module TamB